MSELPELEFFPSAGKNEGVAKAKEAYVWLTKKQVEEINHRCNCHDDLMEKLADYKEGCEGLKLSVQDFRQQRDDLLGACEIILKWLQKAPIKELGALEYVMEWTFPQNILLAAIAKAHKT